MKRAKDKYMINRTKYKDIKRYDHKQMEDFLTDVYKNGYADGKESVPGVELQDVEKALQDVKGIGPVVWNRIKERLAELFRKEQCSYGSIMNLLEIWADGSIQGYLSAKQTLRIIERVKARESPR